MATGMARGVLLTVVVMGLACVQVGQTYAAQKEDGGATSAGALRLRNVVPPLDDPDDVGGSAQRTGSELPIVVPPFVEHVKEAVAGPAEDKVVGLAIGPNGERLAISEPGVVYLKQPDGTWLATDESRSEEDADRPELSPRAFLHCATREISLSGLPELRLPTLEGCIITDVARLGDTVWLGTNQGLFLEAEMHKDYGVDGPLATRITALVADSKGALWVGTPLGLSVRDAKGAWRHIRGRDGLPCEDITALAVDGKDRLWIGTTRGAIHYRPYEEGRKWFYRAGKRYLPDDQVLDVAVTPDGTAAYFATASGLGCIKEVKTTLLERARTVERRVNERHRRLGLVAECMLDDAENPKTFQIGDNDNDGLWTAYHVAAMSLCYGATKDPAALESARQGMHALYMLQNASGTPGLVARSVVPFEEGKTKDPQWRPSPDGKYYWKSDTSSDEVDGHYLAFYAYWEHIARDLPEERDLLIRQIRALTDYIVDNGYVLLDWDGERTRWGFWSPELLNDRPQNYIENGLNSLQMLSFLKVTHYVTGDAKYQRDYDSLIHEHGYLNNVLLEKKVFPDENNHSDDQLGYVAWYPILQLEKEPAIRGALRKAVRRHYKIVAPEKPSFYAFVTATVDPGYVDLDAAVGNLREIPTDRRGWRMENSHRADAAFDPRAGRFGEQQLLNVLPADEREFGKWNGNPYEADGGGDGRQEDDGAAYLLPYWMGRYHKFIAEE